MDGLINREQLAVIVSKLNKNLENHDKVHASVQNLKIGLWSFVGGMFAGGSLIVLEIVLKYLKLL